MTCSSQKSNMQGPREAGVDKDGYPPHETPISPQEDEKREHPQRQERERAHDRREDARRVTPAGKARSQ